MRCENVAVANQFLTMFYCREPTKVNQIHTKEWALIATIDGSEIPEKHRAEFTLTETNDIEFNKEVFDAGLVTQPYTNGPGKFASKFQPDQPYSATIAIEKGCHLVHGTAIFFEQGTRRCVLSDTLFGLSDDEALWFTIYKWAEFQPRKCRPRQDPGLLYYPADYTHVFQKYWDVLNDPVTHPDCNETDHTKASMRHMADHLRPMSLESWEPQVDAETPEKSCRVAHNAALSWRCPIQDAADYWLSPEDRSSPLHSQRSRAGLDSHNVGTNPEGSS
jgi:hypothetical protein